MTFDHSVATGRKQVLWGIATAGAHTLSCMYAPFLLSRPNGAHT
jgi:hypothetical protein